MASVMADRNLLFGLLALQNGLLNQSQLVAAFQAWILDKARTLADHLISLGHLKDAERAVVEAMAALHVQKYGDVEQSLAAIPAGRSTHEGLARLGDPDLEATLGRVRSGLARPDGEADPDRTATYSVGTATSDGQRFRVLRPHARGGLGAVFVAMDTELHREVALKQILDSHADDETSRHRFLLEAEITGGLEHPGIVPVYGLGAHGDGRPYYAMRLIRGDSLKEAIERFHADEPTRRDPGRRSLELRKLLRRFLDVCNAIDYAHSRGVLHRDIKPGNIIVGRHGETLVVDWGLAKATGRSDPSSGERTLSPSSASGSAETLPGSALGTPAYMSPEQAEGDLEHLGPRSDVYSLGATLYCLLTGRPPFQGEAADVIRAVHRGEFRPPRQLDPTIDAALEAACLKAMALKPQDRYGSCRALADDIERWMADEPVTAWREPISRRARRWAKRHRTPVTAAAVALVAGVIGLGSVAGVQARANNRLRDANAAIKQSLAETREAQAQTRAALAQSEESRQQAEAVSDFLVQAFRSPDPSQDGRQVKVVDVLDQAGERLDREFAGSQATRGALLNALGNTFWGLGLNDRSISLLSQSRAVREAALGPDHTDTLRSRNDLARVYSAAGRLPEAIALHAETVKLQETRLGPDHTDTLKGRDYLAIAYAMAGRQPEAIALFEATLEGRRARLGPDHPDTLESGNNLGIGYWLAGRTSEAIALLEATLKLCEAKLGPDHPNTLKSRNNLGIFYGAAGRLPEAIALIEATLKLQEARLGPDHPETLNSRSNLGEAYSKVGRTAEAIALHEATLRTRAAKLGPDHTDTLSGRNCLAIAYLDAGRTAEAIALHEATLRTRAARLGPDHPDTLQSGNNLAIAYASAGRTSEATTLHEATLERRRARLGPDHPDTLESRRNLAQVYESLGRCDEAERLDRDVMARRRKTEEPDSPHLAEDLVALGHHLLEKARWSEAEPMLREGLAIREKVTPDDWRRYEAMSLLGGALLGQDRYAAAEPLIVPGYEGMLARESRIVMPERYRLREAAERVVRLYDEWNKTDEATAWKAKLGMRDLPTDVFASP
jgi:serine/threonine protein kinase